MESTSRVFEIEPPPQATVLLLGATIVLPIFIALIVLTVLHRPPAPSQTALALGIAIAVALLVTTFVVLSLRRRAIELTSSHLVVKAGLFTRRIPYSQLDLHRARIATLGERPDSRTRFKLFGTRVPGYRAGWFSMQDGQRAFVATTTGRALRVPVRDGAAFVGTLSQPDALLAALRDVAAPGAPR